MRKQIQAGLVSYGKMSAEDTKVLTDIAIERIAEQAYHVKKDVAYAHWGNMWAVNDKGNDAFPIFGKYLKKKKQTTGFGKNLPAIDLPAIDINQASKNKWYSYYSTDQLGNALPVIPDELLQIVQNHTKIDMSIYDSAIINVYGAKRMLAKHIDNTEDVKAGVIPIVSISLLNDGEFYYSIPNLNPNKRLPESHMLKLGNGDVIAFGGRSRYINHRVQNGVGTLIPVETTTGTIYATRININIRRAKPVTTSEYSKWVHNCKELKL